MAAETVTALEFQRDEATAAWRVLGWGASAWFQAPGFAAGAALVRRLAARADPVPDVDLRADGVRVRIRPRPGTGALTTADLQIARDVSDAADALGLVPEPSRLDELQLTIDTQQPARAQAFWADVLGYQALGEEDVVDPGWREPSIWLQDMDAPRPLRNRIHIDVVRDLDADARAALLARTGNAEFTGPFGVMLADAEGNEVDVVPAASDWEGRADVADWRLLFSAMARYPTASPSQAVELAEAVARIADDSGIPLLVDVRPGAVTIDSGKDQWAVVDGFQELARQTQHAARGLGLTADPARPRFVQLGFDAVDVDAVRAFWRDALRYAEDPRPGLTDLYDPRRLGPPVFVQDMSADEVDRRAQRNRIHVDLFVPDDQAQARVAAAVAAGGRVVEDAHAPFWWTIADPEGNELDISVSVGREEAWVSS